MKITNFRQINKGCLIASFSIELTHFIFHDVELFQKNDQRWIKLPREKYIDNGVTKYRAKVAFTTKEIQKEFEYKLFPVLEPLLEKPSPQTTGFEGDDVPF